MCGGVFLVFDDKQNTPNYITRYQKNPNINKQKNTLAVEMFGLELVVNKHFYRLVLNRVKRDGFFNASTPCTNMSNRPIPHEKFHYYYYIKTKNVIPVKKFFLKRAECFQSGGR